MADITGEVESAFEAFKKHWVVFVLGGFILVAWTLGSDYRQAGKISNSAAKWPIIGPYFFKGTPLATPAATAPPS